jgi:hypothetical protein
MEALASAWYAAGDRRALFADTYARMTRAMQGAVDAREFVDNAWVARLVDRFAEYYFVAVDAHGAVAGPAVAGPAAAAGPAVTNPALTCPLVWREAFDACTRTDVNELQTILLSINAHINHDLALALADVLEDWGTLDDATRVARLADHAHVNRIIERTVDEIQRDVLARVEPAIAVLDVLLGRMDEWLFARLAAPYRQNVWEDTQRLLAASSPAERRAVVAELDREAQRLGHLILIV